MKPDESTPLKIPIAGAFSSHPTHADGQSDALRLSKRSDRLESFSERSIRQLSHRFGMIVAEHVGSIGMLGSMAITVNALTGPAMVNLPATFAQSGIIPTCVTVVFVCFLSSFCSLNMANVISKVPENQNFEQEIEYSGAFVHFWGYRWYLVTEILFFCCITCLNISSIVDTAQVIDTMCGQWWPYGTSAVQLREDSTSLIHWDHTMCSQTDVVEGLCIPFAGEDGILLTTGNLLTTLLFLPLALMDLKENAAWQIFAFLILLVTSVQFIVQFATSESLNLSNVSLWGSDWDDLLGVVLFNFCLATVIPAWLYEREPHVDVPTVIYGSNIVSAGLYIGIGILGNLAIPNVTDNMLQSMMSGAFGTWLQIGASIFAFAIIGLGIPLFSVLARLNLMGSGSCSRPVANLLAVYLPFAVSWPISNGATTTAILSWGGVLFTSLIAFILPLVLALHVVKEVDHKGYVSVYCGFWTSKTSETNVLRVLLAFAVLSVVVSIVGSLLP